ncbi:hypothetical protein K1719_044455 [Acacia pycnantha]|nr:hypothetical protein K1719_044455 [Acacia pycnantha]
MLDRYSIAFLLIFSWHIVELNASVGDANPYYRDCVKQCGGIGCTGKDALQTVNFLEMTSRMVHGTSKRNFTCSGRNGIAKAIVGTFVWRFYGMQEPTSVAFSVLNLAAHFHGWVSFYILLYYKMPLKDGKKPYYEYVNLWHAYALLSMNSWFWSDVFHSRDVDLTEKLDYSSAVALLGYSLILAILRSFNVRDEATRFPLEKQGGQVGFVVDCEWAEAYSDKIEDKVAAARCLDFHLGWFLDPLCFGDYPKVMREHLGDRLPTFSEEDKKLLANSLDFIGLNHYTSRLISHADLSSNGCSEW